MEIGLLVLAGLVLLTAGAEGLVRGAASLGLRGGLSPLVVGLTVVGFGTSTPELAVSVEAALEGLGDIAIGNVVGSNIANITLILGIAALLRPSSLQARIVRLDAPLVVVCGLLLAALLVDGSLSRLEGVGLLVGLAIFSGWNLLEARREGEPLSQEVAAPLPASRRRLAVDVGLVVVGLALLIVGGEFLIRGAVRLAEAAGVSQAVIGLTLVAVGTSLPELATSVLAALRGHGDIAIGNALGSNVFNILGILGTSALVRPVALGDVRWLDVGAMVGTSVLLVLLLIGRVQLGRGRGALLVAVYVAYVVQVAYR